MLRSVDEGKRREQMLQRILGPLGAMSFSDYSHKAHNEVTNCGYRPPCKINKEVFHCLEAWRSGTFSDVMNNYNRVESILKIYYWVPHALFLYMKPQHWQKGQYVFQKYLKNKEYMFKKWNIIISFHSSIFFPPTPLLCLSYLSNYGFFIFVYTCTFSIYSGSLACIYFRDDLWHWRTICGLLGRIFLLLYLNNQ